MTLPSLQLSMNRIFPFAGKGIKKIQNIGVTYNVQGEYRITTNEDDFLTSKKLNSKFRALQD